MILCRNLRNRHLKDDVSCALQIYKLALEETGVGYDAWEVYYPRCAEGNNKQYVSDCYEVYDFNET